MGVGMATKVAATCITNCVRRGSIVWTVGVGVDSNSDKGVVVGNGTAASIPPPSPPLPPTVTITMMIAAITATPIPPNKSHLGNPKLADGDRGAPTAWAVAPQ